jgi:Mg2+/Co2+ transporter CorB
LNEINRTFFDFITRFFQGISVDAKKKNQYSNEEMKAYIEELKSLIGANSFDQSKFLSFFTFIRFGREKRMVP